MKQITDEVTVKLTGLDGKENAIVKPVQYVELETAEDVLNFMSTAENIPLILAAANYGFNLKARAKVTAAIKQENQGPEVSVNRLLTQMEKNHEKNGKPWNEEIKATKRAFIMANLGEFGIEA